MSRVPPQALHSLDYVLNEKEHMSPRTLKIICTFLGSLGKACPSLVPAKIFSSRSSNPTLVDTEAICICKRHFKK